ncbi:unnamed protein product, partial [Thlaspi arvense]
MQNRWFSHGRASVLNLPSLTVGDSILPPLLVPTDPPDPSTSLSISHFPPHSSPRNHKLRSPPRTAPTMAPVGQASTQISFIAVTTDVEMTQLETVSPKVSDSSSSKTRSENTIPANPTQSPLPNPTFPTIPTTADVQAPAPPNTQPSSQSVHPPNVNQTANHPTLAERIRVFEDRSLRSIPERRRVTQGLLNLLRAPPYSQIQNNLNHMWGKGRKLEIYNNPVARSMIILEKGLWYVGDSMFHVTQWTSAHSSASPPFESIQLWAHLTGVPLDLRHQQGLSLVAGLVGEPIETDEFTKNLVSLTLSHLKVEVNLTKDLPQLVDGEVVEVLVDYPWLPPTCSHCKELGHIVRNCLLLPPPPRTAAPPPKKAQKKSAPISKSVDSVHKAATEIPKDSVVNDKETDVVADKVNFVRHLCKWTLQLNVDPNSNGVSSKVVPPIPRSSSLPPRVPVHLPFIVALPATITPSGKPYPYSPPESTEKTSLKQTHIKDLTLNQLMSTLCPRWRFTSNHLSDGDGCTIIIWRAPATVRMLHQSRQTFTCEVSLLNSNQFTYTAVYASNSSSERTDLWVELLNLQQSPSLQAGPWMIGGDFNEIIHHAEHSNPVMNSLSAHMIDFIDCLSQMGMFDLRFQGPRYTWTNCQPDSPDAKSLTVYQLPKVGTRPFKFFNYLTKHPNFLSVLQEAWIQAGRFGSTLTYLCWKQKIIKGALKELNRENFSQIEKRVSEANSLLQDVQVQALQECYFKQKLRINWLQEGASYFHRVAQARESFNSIRSFLLASGVVLFDLLEMSIHAINHFKSIFGPNMLPPIRISSPL